MQRKSELASSLGFTISPALCSSSVNISWKRHTKSKNGRWRCTVREKHCAPVVRAAERNAKTKSPRTIRQKNTDLLYDFCLLFHWENSGSRSCAAPSIWTAPQRRHGHDARKRDEITRTDFCQRFLCLWGNEHDLDDPDRDLISLNMLLRAVLLDLYTNPRHRFPKRKLPMCVASNWCLHICRGAYLAHACDECLHVKVVLSFQAKFLGLRKDIWQDQGFPLGSGLNDNSHHATSAQMLASSDAKCQRNLDDSSSCLQVTVVNKGQILRRASQPNQFRNSVSMLQTSRNRVSVSQNRSLWFGVSTPSDDCRTFTQI